ncbi:DUF4097 family beta strand repeat-containing protein [Microbacterium dauci]|uniref:DUF4097 family beta strand repeat-containing protein n=1 Tax=Microbacterium dauci TaxID=3048008 RepID=A0ABT6ZG85_9MICO|nr:DUF4097 family beta strand repeat-containing protein [Microbacterium sp. LX3-4]MDJ1114647.1 DUF4097 family beta strand repeat-containing protein [Microbacterium sp. LX3-4]
MTTDLQPPAAAPGATPPVAPPPRSSSRAVAIIAIVVGSAVVLGAVLSSVASALWFAGDRPGARTADATGIEMLSVDVSAGDLTIVYADVEEARLDADRGDRGWRLSRSGGELRVENGTPWWAGWRGFDIDADRATLTLPERYATTPLDAHFEVSAGSLSADGEYSDLQVHVGAGDATVTGSATYLTVDVSAGRADVDLADVQEGDLQIGAGDIFADFSGDAPSDLRIDVSAGSLDATLPDGTYDVTSEVSAGGFDNELRTASGAASTIDVQVSAGGVTLRPAR